MPRVEGLLELFVIFQFQIATETPSNPYKIANNIKYLMYNELTFDTEKPLIFKSTQAYPLILMINIR